MKISSPDFKDKQTIPSKYTCEGEDINPALIFDDIPKNAKTLALIMDDPDAPRKTFVHWILFNMPTKNKILENSSLGTEGINSAGKIGYIGPCPPSGVHRYFFKLYALDCILDLKKGCTKEELLSKMEDHILQKAELIGLYEKKKIK